MSSICGPSVAATVHAGLLSKWHTAREVMIPASSDEMTKRLDGN